MSSLGMGKTETGMKEEEDLMGWWENGRQSGR